MSFLMNFSIFGLLMVSLTRVGEIVPFLAPLHLGKVMLGIGIIAATLWNPQGYLSFIRTPMGKCLLIILILALVGIPFSVWQGGALDKGVRLARMLLLVVTLFALSENGRIGTYRTSCIISALILALFMVFDKGTGRLHVGSTYDPNDMALLFVVFLPIIIVEAVNSGKLLRIVAWCAALCALMGIALTQSRGGIIALSAVGLHSFMLAKKRRWLLLLLVVAGGVVVMLTADESFWDRFRSLFDESDYNFDDKHGRIAIWKDGIDLMLSNPLFGVGIGQFVDGLGMSESGIYLTAHNSFIQIGTELGIPGIIVFVLLLASIVRSCRSAIKSGLLSQKEKNRRTALLISTTGYCCGGFFLSQAYGIVLYSLVILAALMHVQAQQVAPMTASPSPSHKLKSVPEPEQSENQSLVPPKPAYAQNTPGQPSEKKIVNINGKKHMKRQELLEKGDTLAKKRKALRGEK